MRADVVGHGADHGGFRAVFSGQPVNTRRFHFDADNTVLLHRVKQAGVGVVEQIRRENIADVHRSAVCFRRFNHRLHHIKIGNRGKIMAFKSSAIDFGVGTTAQANHNIAHMDVATHRTAGADANDFFHPKIGDQLFDVNRARRNPHAMPHH